MPGSFFGFYFLFDNGAAACDGSCTTQTAGLTGMWASLILMAIQVGGKNHH